MINSSENDYLHSEQLPTIAVPLVRPDPPVILDLGAALRTADQRARDDLRVDYTKAAQPPRSAQDSAWAAQLLAQGKTEQPR